MKFIGKAFASPYRTIFPVLFFFLALPLSLFPTPARGEDKTYVGREACKGCHEEKYASFIANSKMSNSFQGPSLRKKGLTGEELKKCYECHTTGYGKPGGFRSEAETPDLKNLGCEACHGPGSVHIGTGSPKDIKRHVEIKDCQVCHDQNRVATVNFKPTLFGGAH